MLSCFRTVWNCNFTLNKISLFFSCETSSVIYWCNKLWASGVGLSFYFYSFFSRKSQTLPVICGTVWDSLHKLLQPLFHSSQYQGLLLYVRTVSQIGTWPWWRVTLPSNSPRSRIKLLKSPKAPLHILFMSLAGTVVSRERENTTHKFVFHTRDFQDLCIQNESTLWSVRVCVGWDLPVENWTTVFKSHGHQAVVHLRSSMLSGGWWLFCTRPLRCHWDCGSGLFQCWRAIVFFPLDFTYDSRTSLLPIGSPTVCSQLYCMVHLEAKWWLKTCGH